MRKRKPMKIDASSMVEKRGIGRRRADRYEREAKSATPLSSDDARVRRHCRVSARAEDAHRRRLSPLFVKHADSVDVVVALPWKERRSYSEARVRTSA